MWGLTSPRLYVHFHASPTPATSITTAINPWAAVHRRCPAPPNNVPRRSHAFPMHQMIQILPTLSPTPPSCIPQASYALEHAPLKKGMSIYVGKGTWHIPWPLYPIRLHYLPLLTCTCLYIDLLTTPSCSIIVYYQIEHVSYGTEDK